MDILLAETPPIGKHAPRATSDAIAVRAELDLGDLRDRLYAETIRLLQDQGLAGLSGDALASALESGLRDLSDAPIDKAARGAITKAFNLGGNLEAQADPERITQVVRSAILDENTCDPCVELDGFVTTLDDPAYLENIPPKKCNGRDLCRCIYYYRAA